MKTKATEKVQARQKESAGPPEGFDAEWGT